MEVFFGFFEVDRFIELSKIWILVESLDSFDMFCLLFDVFISRFLTDHVANFFVNGSLIVKLLIEK